MSCGVHGFLNFPINPSISKSNKYKNLHSLSPPIDHLKLKKPIFHLFLSSSMEDYRSKSYSHGGGMELERYYEPRPNFNPSNPNDFRSHSVSYASNYGPQTITDLDVVANGGGAKDFKFKKGKSANVSASNSWSLSDPEFQRKRRVASYKVYSVEGRVKGSFRKSFRWIKDKYTHVVYGWW